VGGIGALMAGGLGLVPLRLAGEELSAEQLYARYVPVNKQLPPDWLASLTTRGHTLDAGLRYTSHDTDLDVIGMTVGGVCCGTVYLSGDGRLWVWDIFNQHHEGVVPNKAPIPEGLGSIQTHAEVRERDGANFINPPRASDRQNGVDARFSLHHGDARFALDRSGWDTVVFTGRWPVGTVEYGSARTPLKVRLEAYSPFIPLNFDDSSLPVTVMEYTVENPTDNDADVVLAGHLNNPCGQFSSRAGRRFTEIVSEASHRGLFHGLRDDEMPLEAPVLDAGSMAMAAIAPEGITVDAAANEVRVALTVPARGRATARFVIAWHFPHLSPRLRVGQVKRHYAVHFADARAVLAHVSKNLDTLGAATRLWVRTWNDSTLPQWLLDRSILTANTLQTENCLHLDGRRFWAWEGIGCCHGTCGHVWQYSQGHARLFPAIERNLREVTDYGLAQNADGSIRFRGTNNNQSAIDAQSSYILRTLRDHQLSDDPDYLRRVWPAARQALQYLLDFDAKDERGGLDGLLDGEQHNTLDAEWYGKVHVLCSMYLAALRAGEELAREAGDEPFATTARKVYERGRTNIGKLFNGEFYEQQEDPAHLDKIGVGKGCYIDQVMGQFWANQTGLGRLYDADHQKSALRSLWKYNFVPDYGPFRQQFKLGRHYATPGDRGLLMCTWPKGGLRPDFTKHWQYAYFNEFMTGFEYQAAAHMVAERDEDLVEHGLAITRAVHDRYSAAHGRNPYNEIECSDHYARAGSSYAVFLAVCGFHFDQAKGLLRFDPVILKHRFRAPFLTSEAWGTFTQTTEGASITLTRGTLRIRTVELPAFAGKSFRRSLNGSSAPDAEIQLSAGDTLRWDALA
jgi:uncharacterized protein (DUF608 family)